MSTKELKQPGELVKLWRRASESEGENADRLFSVLVNSLRYMGADFLDESLRMWQRYSEGTRTKDREESGDVFHVDRFRPTVYTLCEDEIHGGVDLSIFPRINSDASHKVECVEDGFKGSGRVYKFKKFTPGWAGKRLIGTAVGEEDWRRNGGRIIILVLGGVSLVEVRAAYEIGKKYKRQVFIGESQEVNGKGVRIMSSRLHLWIRLSSMIGH
jgi:hypothetical protein